MLMFYRLARVLRTWLMNSDLELYHRLSDIGDRVGASIHRRSYRKSLARVEALDFTIWKLEKEKSCLMQF